MQRQVNSLDRMSLVQRHSNLSVKLSPAKWLDRLGSFQMFQMLQKLTFEGKGGKEVFSCFVHLRHLIFYDA